MKKLLLLIATLFLSISLMGQTKDTTKMSNYEKYLLAKEQGAQDTLYNNDTVYVTIGEAREWDDLYYTAKKNDLKIKAKDIRLERRKLNTEQQAAYYDAKEEVYNDLYDNYYTDYRFRLNFGFRPYYYGWYDPLFYNSWYWDSPFYFGFGYNNWYFNGGWNYPIYYGNNWNLHQKFNNRHDWRRDKPSHFINPSKPHHDPITVNRTVSVDRRTGSVLSVQNNGVKRIAPSTSTNSYSINNRRTNTTDNSTKTGVYQSTERRVGVNSQTQNRSNSERPTYNSTQRSYTPSYETPRMSTRPAFNNSKTNEVNRSVSQPNTNYNNTRSNVNTQSNTSTVVRRSSSNYSAPVQRSNNYSTPSRSSVNSSSNYSTPSRSYNNSSSNYNSGNSGVSRSSSYSGGNSGGFSGGSSSSSGGSSDGSSSSSRR